jgi:hypothetical protein
MIHLLDDERLDTMAADWLRKHRHGVDTSEAYDDLRAMLADVREETAKSAREATAAGPHCASTSRDVSR